MPCLRLSGLLLLCFFSSCTMILSTTIPGKPEKTLPREWWGKYEVIAESPMPDKRDSVKHDKEIAVIDSNHITWQNSDGVKTFSLDDSLRYSVIYGQSRYLSLLMPQGLYAIFKVVKTRDTLNLYSLSSDADIKKTELNKYFENVDKIQTGDDEFYRVTLVEKKLDAYFKSGIPSKQVIKLVPER